MGLIYSILFMLVVLSIVVTLMVWVDKKINKSKVVKANVSEQEEINYIKGINDGVEQHKLKLVRFTEQEMILYHRSLKTIHRINTDKNNGK